MVRRTPSPRASELPDDLTNLRCLVTAVRKLGRTRRRLYRRKFGPWGDFFEAMDHINGIDTLNDSAAAVGPAAPDQDTQR